MYTIINENEIQGDWKVGIITPIYKKGDRKNCSNYRRVKLTSCTMKVLTRILEKKDRLAYLI